VRLTPAGASFAHPLARAAVLAGSDVAERAAAHRALASVLDGDRRVWHLAALADGPDERVAAELDAAARHAGGRGSAAAMSAAYERAAALSPDPRRAGVGWPWPPRRRPTPGSYPGRRTSPGRPGGW
jgi:hypothetical protein